MYGGWNDHCTVMSEVRQGRYSGERDKDLKLWHIFQKLARAWGEMAKRGADLPSIWLRLCSSTRYPSAWNLLTETKLAVLSEKVEFTFLKKIRAYLIFDYPA